jgi:hypothetical protein
MQPSVIMAQLGNETGYQIGPNYNLTNIKLDGNGTGFQSGYYTQKSDTTSGKIDKYEKYANIEQWGKAYVKFLNYSNYRSCHGLATYQDTCHALGNSPFAESGYRYGSVHDGWKGTRGQVLIDMIEKNNLTRFDKGYNPKGKSNVAPITNKNQQAVNKANAQKQADLKNQKALQDKLTLQDRREEIEDQNAIKKAQLTRNQQQLNIAKAKAKVNQIARENAIKLAKQNALRREQLNAIALKNAHKTNNPIPNTKSRPTDSKAKEQPNSLRDISQAKVLKSGLSLIGLIALVFVMNNAELEKTELE